MKNTLNISEESEMIDKCAGGDQLAQKQLYETFSGKMMGVCLRYASDSDEAQDILQDGFIKVFQKIHSFKGNGSLEGWIRKIFVNTALDNLRKNKVLKQSVEINEAEFMIPQNDFIEGKMEAQSLLLLLKKVPVGYRTVFNLYAIEGYSHKDIAKELEISENTSKSQFSRAKTYIQNMLKKEEVI